MDGQYSEMSPTHFLKVGPLVPNYHPALVLGKLEICWFINSVDFPSWWQNPEFLCPQLQPMKYHITQTLRLYRLYPQTWCLTLEFDYFDNFGGIWRV